MTVATWPTELPRPNRQGYSRQIEDPRLVKRAETGLPGYRPRWSQAAQRVNLVIDVSRAERAVFDNFYRSLKFGSLPFWMPDPTTDGWALLSGGGRPVLDGDGRPVLLAARWLCLFGATTPSETIAGVRFQISFSVMVMP